VLLGQRAKATLDKIVGLIASRVSARAPQPRYFGLKQRSEIVHRKPILELFAGGLEGEAKDRRSHDVPE
jgi:hypothetical protein